MLTHRKRDPLPQKSGTFTFVGEGIEHALRLAAEAAKGRDVIVMGADTAQQALKTGLVDELNLQLVPRLLGDGRRLFDGIDAPGPAFEMVRALPSPHAMHLCYRTIR